MLANAQSGIINAIGTEIIILILFDFMKKDNTINKIANTGISIKNNINKMKSYIPITIGIKATNPNMRKFRLLNMIIH